MSSNSHYLFYPCELSLTLSLTQKLSKDCHNLISLALMKTVKLNLTRRKKEMYTTFPIYISESAMT